VSNTNFVGEDIMATYSVTRKRADNDIRIAMPDTAKSFNWLRYSWGDFARAPRITILLGRGFTLLCLAGYAAVAAKPVLSPTVPSILLTTSLLAAAAAYYVARHHQQNRPLSLHAGIAAIRRWVIGIGLFSILSVLIVGAWKIFQASPSPFTMAPSVMV